MTKKATTALASSGNRAHNDRTGALLGQLSSSGHTAAAAAAVSVRPGSHIAIGARLKALARLHTHNPLCSRMRQHQNNNKTEKSRANFSWAKVHSYSERGHCGKPFFTCAVSRYSALSGDPIQTTQIFNLSSAQRSSPRLGFACP